MSYCLKDRIRCSVYCISYILCLRFPLNFRYISGIWESSAKFPGLCSWGVGRIPARNFVLLESLKHFSQLEKGKRVVHKSFHSQQWIFSLSENRFWGNPESSITIFYSLWFDGVKFFYLGLSLGNKSKQGKLHEAFNDYHYIRKCRYLLWVLEIWIQIIIFDQANRWDFFLLSVLSLFWGF
jgi:hypothetical protein